MKLRWKLTMAACGLSLMLPMAQAEQDHEVGVDFRVDYEMHDSDDTSLKTTTGEKANANDDLSVKKVNIVEAKLNFSGKVADKTTYAAKLDLNNDEASSAYGLGNHINEMWVHQGLNENMGLKIGKIRTGAGGIEASHDPADKYLNSMAYDSAPRYATGLSLDYNYGDNDFQLQLLNNPNAGVTVYNQGTPMIGLVWNGSFADGMVEPVVSYHKAINPEQKIGPRTKAADVAAEKSDTFLAIGARVNLMNDDLTLEVDFLTNTFEKKTSTGDDVDNSLVLGAKYRHEAWMPQFHYEMGTKEVNGADSEDRVAMSLALEYYPVEGSNFRYHVAYNVASSEYKTKGTHTLVNGGSATYDHAAGKEIEESSIVFGAAFGI